jgi:hypothetical protein
LAACIPPLTAALSLRLCQRRELALLAGSLAILPAFYLAYLPTTDSFGACMLLGIGFFWLLPASGLHEQQPGELTGLKALGLGLVSGLLHLARAEGAVWLVVALLAIWMSAPHQASRQDLGRVAGLWLACLAGYLLVMAPWFARNLAAFGSPLAPAGSRALWIREYDELFSYPAGMLTFRYWWDSGLAAIAGARLWAAGQNLQSAIAVQGEVLLAPLILLGMRRLRSDLRVRAAGIAWLLLFLLMTLVFPFQGARGGFFHAGAAFQPFFWAIAPLGLESFLEWGGRRRGWRIDQARRFFQAGVVGLVFLITVFAIFTRLFASGTERLAWDASFDRYTRLAKHLSSHAAEADRLVLVNNAPGYAIASGSPAISIPHGDLQVVCAAAERYQGRILLLEIDQVAGAAEIFERPHDQLCLRYLDTFETVRIFKIQ